MGKYRITLDGKTYEMEIEVIHEEAVPTDTTKNEISTYWSKNQGKGKSSVVQVIDPAAAKAISKDDRTVMSPMPGTILRILVSVGERVKKGQPVFVLEAMKMENEIIATRSGMITKILVREGQTVAGHEALLEIGE